MVSLLILKLLYNISDKSVVTRWVDKPYYQHFSGMKYLQWEFPCNPRVIWFTSETGLEKKGLKGSSR